MSGKSILITRSSEDGGELRDALQSLGHRVIHEPLTHIMLNHTARLSLTQLVMQEPDAVLLTSRYGARALAALTEARDLSLLCVGEATADIAGSLGFQRVATTGQTAEDMSNYIVDAYDVDAKLLYVSAAHATGELETQLQQFGFGLQRVIAYEAMASDALSDTLIEQIRRAQIDGVALLSERTATIWLTLLKQAEITAQARALTAYCISANAAEPLVEAGWDRVIVGKQPTLASLVESIDNEAA